MGLPPAAFGKSGAACTHCRSHRNAAQAFPRLVGDRSAALAVRLSALEAVAERSSHRAKAAVDRAPRDSSSFAQAAPRPDRSLVDRARARVAVGPLRAFRYLAAPPAT
jgi:hypothetical protein